MPNALVTGATGFIGRHVATALLDRGYDLTCLARSGSSTADLDPRCRVAVGDIMDPPSLEAPVRGADVVFHLASLLKVPWKPAFMHVNVEGTRAVATAVARRTSPPPLIVVSSLAAAGPSSVARTEDMPPRPISIYGRVKLASERAAVEHAARAPISIVRPPMVYGPDDRYGLMLFRSAVRGLHAVPTLAEHRLSLVYAIDLADLLVAIGERGERITELDPSSPRGAGVYHAAHDETPTYAELGRLVASAAGAPPPFVLRLPSFVSGAAALAGELAGRARDRPSFLNLDKWREAMAGSWICDATKAKRGLGFAPTTARDGLAATAAWYRSRGWLPTRPATTASSPAQAEAER
jgi:nucleoside-diphosphate-sugar epimerase